MEIWHIECIQVLAQIIFKLSALSDTRPTSYKKLSSDNYTFTPV